jgi:hypothetical protein
VDNTAYPGIFKSTVGVIFLGTPHRGTNAFTPQSQLLAAIAAQSDLQHRIEPQVLDDLQSENGTILDVSGDFALVCGDHHRKILITCFFEQRVSNIGKIVGRNDIQVSGFLLLRRISREGNISIFFAMKVLISGVWFAESFFSAIHSR